MRLMPRSSGGKTTVLALGAYIGFMSYFGFAEAKDLLQRDVAYKVMDSDGVRTLKGVDAVTENMRPKGSLVDNTVDNAFFYYPMMPGIKLACAMYGKE